MPDQVKKEDGGPAFPVVDYKNPGVWNGMTLRDYFAAKIAAGIATSLGFQGSPFETLAEHAYQFADALIAERNKS